LDPAPDVSFEAVIAGALEIRDRVWADPDIFLASLWPGRIFVIEIFVAPGMDPFSLIEADTFDVKNKIGNHKNVLLRPIAPWPSQKHAVVASLGFGYLGLQRAGLRVEDLNFVMRRRDDIRQAVAIHIIDELIDTFIDAGETDFVESFATPLPLTVFGLILGLPPDRRGEFRGYVEAVMRAQLSRGLSEAELLERWETILGFDDFFRDFLADRRNNPGDDVA